MGRIICILLVLGVCISLIRTLYHTRQLHQFAKQLFDMNLPVDTKVVEQYTTYGNAYGKEKRMRYTAVLVLETSQSDELIKGYYFKQNYRSVNEESEVGALIEIMRPHSPYVQSSYLNQTSIHLESLEQAADYEGLVIIMITDYQ